MTLDVKLLSVGTISLPVPDQLCCKEKQLWKMDLICEVTSQGKIRWYLKVYVC